MDFLASVPLSCTLAWEGAHLKPKGVVGYCWQLCAFYRKHIAMSNPLD